MPSNVTLNAGSGGSVATTKQRTHDGDTTQTQVVTIAGVTGTEDSYTFADINGSAANGLEVDVTRVQGTVTVDGSGSTQPVSGTVTANLGATDNAVLDNIDTNTDFGQVTGGGTETGALRVTIANNSTGVLSVDDGGSTLSIDDGGSSITVDGTVTANAGTGTFTVDNAGTFAVQVDGAALTALQTIDNTVLADDAAFTLGSSSVNMAGAIRDDSLSTLTAVEGDAVPLRVNSTGALHVTGAGGGTQYNVDDAAGATDTGTLSLAVRDDSLTTLTPVDGDYVPLRVSSTGALHVTGGGGGTEYTVDAVAPASPTGSTFLMERDDALSTLTPAEGDWVQPRCDSTGALYVNAVNAGGTATDDAAFGVATDTVAVIGALADETTTDSVDEGDVGAVRMSLDRRLLVDAQIAGQDADVTIADGGNSITVDNADITTIAGAVSGTEMQVDVVAALPAGTNNIGDVDVASIAAGTNVIGDVGLSGARTSGGTTPYRNVDVDETEDAVKASAGQVYWIHAMNLTASVLYLHFYNATTGNVTVGTTTPTLTFPLADQGASTDGAGFTLSIPNGIEFDTAITIACTTTVGGSAGPAANGCIVNLGYA